MALTVPEPLRRYARWLHTGWPAGVPEKLPKIRDDGGTNLPGLYVTGDLTGVPLLKFAAHTGAGAVRTIVADPGFQAERKTKEPGTRDLVILGAGVSGMAAALEAREAGVQAVVFEARRKFQTIADFPRGKPIYAYPGEMIPAGKMRFRRTVKELLLEDLEAQTREIAVTPGRVTGVRRRRGVLEVELDGGDRVRALRVIVAIGRSGNFRKLGAPGEDLDKVHNRLHDPGEFAGADVLVVGGGDSALEAASALAGAGARVTLSYRRAEFTRPKPDNLRRLHPGVNLEMESTVREIREGTVLLSRPGEQDTEIPNDTVFAMLGREPPLDLFRRVGIPLRGETRGAAWIAVIGLFAAVTLMYAWKEGLLAGGGSFPGNVPALLGRLGDWWSVQVSDRSTLTGTLAVSMQGRSFYYTLLYTAVVGLFGVARIRRRRTPYVTVQTTVLFLVQLVPLFLLPELLLPWLGYNGAFDGGTGGALADALFEKTIPQADYLAGLWPDWGHPRAYWRSYGFILAWPLSVYNVFTSHPMPAWLVIAFLQTFVVLPVIVLRWGKGAFCGWICSCGGLAETLGDTLRERMPHGPGWNRLNMVGQALLAVAFVFLAIRILGWVFPGSWMNTGFDRLLHGPLSWKWTVDVFIAGVLGVGLVLLASGRVWCRFACPLAALMHIYGRFGRFRIFADKKKCISCNVCTAICHQGIDVMNFASRGAPMTDPQCVRCSACVQSCPTGVLFFGRADRRGGIAAADRLAASPVRIREN